MDPILDLAPYTINCRVSFLPIDSWLFFDHKQRVSFEFDGLGGRDKELLLDEHHHSRLVSHMSDGFKVCKTALIDRFSLASPNSIAMSMRAVHLPPQCSGCSVFFAANRG